MTNPAADDPGVVWVRSEVTADGTHVLAVEFDADTNRPLDSRVDATSYAETVLTAAAYAEYDAAVLRQLTRKVGVPVETAAEVVKGLRGRRPTLDDAATAPLRLEPGVSASTGNAFLTVQVNGKAVGQWTVEDARSHASAVLEGRAVANLDDLYHRLLTDRIGLDAGTAHAVVGDLADHREETR